jgi:hypothetical protein
MLTVTDGCNKYSIDSLSPALQYIVKKGRIKNRLGYDFSFKDFPELEHGVFRQRIHRLKKMGWIIPTIKDFVTFYKIKGENSVKTKRIVTHEGMDVGTNMQDIINEASKQIPTIHDIKIKFTSKQLYKNALAQGMTQNPSNRGIFLDKQTLAKDIYVQIAVYPETVIIDLSCTWNPIIYDIRGAQELLGHLNLLQYYLYTTFKTRDIPESLDWVVTHYHLNQDGQTEFSGEPFQRTISDMVGGFMRIYAKRYPDKSTRMRLERIITPNCTVNEQVNDMNNLGNYLYSDEEDLAKIMPSQILAYNRLGVIIQKQVSLYNPTYSGATFI